MSIRTVKIRSAVAALALLAGMGGVAGFGALGSAAPAGAAPSSTITVQDDGVDGAGVDADGTQGEFHAATTGTVSGPLMDAVPQVKAG